MTVPPQFRVLAVAAGWFVPFLLAQKPPLPAVQEVQGALGGELQGIFTLNGTAQGQRVSPTYISGDFDGDGRSDLAALVSLQAGRIRQILAAKPTWSIPGLTITKVLGKGVSLREAKEAQLTLIDLAQNFADSLVLLIWHDFSGSAKGKAVPRFALLDFCNNGELTMTVSRKPLKATAAGDSPVVAAPHFRGDTLRFLDHKNEGTAVYWDGARYLWYPIE